MSAIACVFLLLSYIFLPVEKTGRHYLNISIVCAIVLMNVSLTLRHPLPLFSLHHISAVSA